MLRALRQLVCLLSVLVPFAAIVADDGEPAVVSITVEEGNVWQICKGVAVNTHTILTAAHCVAGASPENVRVDSRTVSSYATTVRTHPNYNVAGRLPRNDVAVLNTRKRMTAQPMPVRVSAPVASGGSIFAYNIGGEDSGLSFEIKPASRLVVADVERVILDYIELRRDSLTNTAIINDFERRLLQGDPAVKRKIDSDFGGFLFSLYGKSRTSICMGDSGAPALTFENGKMAVVALATATASLEAESNPRCGGNGTSIFTSLNADETVRFLKECDPDIKFE